MLLVPQIIGLVLVGVRVRSMANKLEHAIKFQIAREAYRRQLLLNLVLIFHRALPAIGRAIAGLIVQPAGCKLGHVIKLQIAKAEFHRQQFHSPALIFQLASRCIIPVGPNVRQTENKREV